MDKFFEGHVDPIAGSNNFSIQIDNHIDKTTYILDNPVPSREIGKVVIESHLLKLAKKHGLFTDKPISVSCKIK
jgi:hypothetical protein